MPAAVAALSTSAQHAAGIFANRNLDGPEIGTLVVIVDRAKNLPNLRTMGKQNPYCAARLGKMALKTETDRRGGQTPKWDQELRFKVHESLDYQKLKLSVFNEDRKTDLVGETWIELDGVLRRGGGQNDSWHELHNRGKYAGQIRIELTFYDLRPREEKPAPEEQATTDVSQPMPTPDLTHHTIGPRDPNSKRKTFQQQQDYSHVIHGDGEDRLGAIPAPRQGLRSFHTPPRVGSMADLRSGDDMDGEPDYALTPDGGALPQEHSPYDYPEVAESPVADFAYSDDPYALAAAHVGVDYDTDQNSAYLPYRHERVQELSGTPRSRMVQHAHSPSLPPHHDRSLSSPHSAAAGPPPADVYNNPYAAPTREFASAPGGRGHAYRNSAPPPPSHRNSAPEAHAVPRAPFAGMTPYRPQPQHASYSDSHESVRGHAVAHSFDGYGSQARETQFPAPSRRRSANVYENQDAYGDDGDDTRFDLPVQQQSSDMHYDSYHGISPYDEAYQAPQARPRSYDPAARAAIHDQMPHHVSSGNGPQIVKPRAISPSTPPHHQAIRRKSVNSSPQDGNVPFSPDSFDAYNPHAAQSSPTVTGGAGPTPMFETQRNSTQASMHNERQSPSAVPVPDLDGRIRDSRGNVIDPSDHLPPSTHAPEPEKKGSDKHRATITATIKTRFGPREARPAHVAMTRTANYSTPTHTPSPLSNNPTPPGPSHTQSAAPSPLAQREAMAAAARQRMQKRNPGSTGPGSGPLAPSTPGALNQAGPGYHRAGYDAPGGGAPPPVPMKIPLDEPDYDTDGLPHGELSQEMGRIDLGPSPLQALEVRYGGVGGQRARRSRFGA